MTSPRIGGRKCQVVSLDTCQQHQTIILVILYQRDIFVLRENVSFRAKKSIICRKFCFFSVKHSPVESHRLLVEAYSEAALSETCRDCFRRFKSDDFDVEDKETEWPKLIQNAEAEILFASSMSNTKRICRIIRSCSINHFHMFKSIGNDSKAKKLDMN